jgi:hypothetical protein
VDVPFRVFAVLLSLCLIFTLWLMSSAASCERTYPGNGACGFGEGIFLAFFGFPLMLASSLVLVVLYNRKKRAGEVLKKYHTVFYWIAIVVGIYVALSILRIFGLLSVPFLNYILI